MSARVVLLAWCLVIGLVGCVPQGLVGERGVLVLTPVSGPARGFGVAVGATVTVTVARASGASLGGALSFEAEDPSILGVRGALVLVGRAEGMTRVRALENGALIDRFVIVVGAPEGVGFMTPEQMVVGSLEVAGGSFVQVTPVLTDREGRLLLDDAATTPDGAPPAALVFFAAPVGTERVVEIQSGGMTYSDSVPVTSGEVDTILRFGRADEVVREIRGGDVPCFVGFRDGAVVLGAPMTFAADAPQTLTPMPRLTGATCVSPSGPGAIRLTGAGEGGASVAVAFPVGPS